MENLLDKKRLKVCNFNAVRLSQLYPQETTKKQKCPKYEEANAKMRKCKNAKL